MTPYNKTLIPVRDESDGDHDVCVSHRDFERIVDGDSEMGASGLPDWYKPMAWIA
jgi:hypothetical protein